jgi:hypothetical protein
MLYMSRYWRWTWQAQIYYILYIIRKSENSAAIWITTGSELQLRIPAGSPWNIGLKSASFAFVLKCSIAKREILFNFFEDFVFVVTNGCYIFYTSCCSLACHVSIADWFIPFIGRAYVDMWHIDTWHILIGRSTFTELWSDGPPICEIWKKKNELGGNLLTRGMSYILLGSRKIQQQVVCFELPRVRSFNFEFPQEHRPEIGKFCFRFEMFDRKTWNFVQLFWRFCLCGHEWMLYILHIML